MTTPPLDCWIEKTCPKLAEAIGVHIESLSDSSWEDQETLVRCIMTSIRAAWPAGQAETSERLQAVTTLFEAIKHSDEDHQRWLKAAIDKHFNL